MTLDRKDYKSAIPQLEKRLSQVEKIGKDAFNKFEDIAHQTQLDAAEAERKVLALDYQMTTTRVQMEYQLCTTGQDPTEANWQTSMPSITYGSYQGKTLWYRSKTYVNDIVVQTTPPMTVNLMDGVYSFVNTVSGNTGWTTIDGDTIQTGKITSRNGYCYFDIDNNNFQMKDNSTLASSTNALAWDNGQLYVKGKVAIGNSTTDKKYYTEMTGGGFDIVANDVNLAHIGYGNGNSSSGSQTTAPYYTLGTRTSNTSTDIGNYSVVAGTASLAKGYSSVALGSGLVVNRAYGVAVGHWNEGDSNNVFEVGFGSLLPNLTIERQNVFSVSTDGVATASGGIVADGQPSGLYVQSDSFSQIIQSHTNGDYTKTYTKASYYPIGVVGFSMTGTKSGYLEIKRCFLSSVSDASCTFTYRIRNSTDDNITPNFVVRILWVRSE